MCDELIGTAQNFQRSPVCSLVRVRRWSASLVAARVDQAAFEPLYRRYLALVYWYCSRRLGSKETGKDAMAQYSSYQVLINVDLHVRGELGKANEIERTRRRGGRLSLRTPLTDGRPQLRDPDREILALKHSIDRLISLLEQEAGITARSEPSSRLERLLAQIDRLTLALEAANHKLETASETQFRQLVDRPEVNREERNTRSDYQDANDE